MNWDRLVEQVGALLEILAWIVCACLVAVGVAAVAKLMLYLLPWVTKGIEG